MKKQPECNEDLRVKGGKMSWFFGLGREKLSNAAIFLIIVGLCLYVTFSLLKMPEQMTFFKEFIAMCAVFLFGLLAGGKE